MSKRYRTFAGMQLRVLRKRRGLMQADMAAQLGISPSYLSQLEHDDRPLTPRLIEQLVSWTPAKTPRFEAFPVIHSGHWTESFDAPTQPVFADGAPGAAE